jgi:hypothetical protein
LILLLGIVIRKIGFQLFEERSFSLFLTFQTDSHKRCDGLAHTAVG